MKLDQEATAYFLLAIKNHQHWEDFNLVVYNDSPSPNPIILVLNKFSNGIGTCYKKEPSMFGKALRLLIKIWGASGWPGGPTFSELILMHNIGYVNFVLEGYQNKPNKATFVCLGVDHIKGIIEKLNRIQSEPILYEKLVTIYINDYNSANK